MVIRETEAGGHVVFQTADAGKRKGTSFAFLYSDLPVLRVLNLKCRTLLARLQLHPKHESSRVAFSGTSLPHMSLAREKK